MTERGYRTVQWRRGDMEYLLLFNPVDGLSIVRDLVVKIGHVHVQG